jgi:chromosome segregation ATPase
MRQGNDEKPKTDRDGTIARLRMLTTKSRDPDAPAKDMETPGKPPSRGSERGAGAGTPIPPTRSPAVAARPAPVIDLEWAEAAHRSFVATVNAKISELVASCRTLERERAEIEVMRVDLHAAVEAAEARIAEAEAFQGNEKLEELENKLVESNDENVRLTDLLLTARDEFDTLVDYIEEQERLAEEAERNKPDPNQPTDREQTLQLELEQLRVQIDFLSTELQELRNAPPPNEEELEDLRVQVEHLKQELKIARDVPPQDDSEIEQLQLEIDQLRRELSQVRKESMDHKSQAAELSSQIARMKGPNQRERSQVMSWEERKQAMLEQLESESEEASPAEKEQLLEIERVIQETSDEIQKRDAEIDDLRNLLAQQSMISQDGLAIGAAAIAEAIDSDALVIAERMKLKELQAEWEQKQRQAEIEMSLERAKLARERLELQEKIRDMEDSESEHHAEPGATPPEARVGRRKGKWLSRLGLKEE